jgi:hypothetical protein
LQYECLSGSLVTAILSVSEEILTIETASFTKSFEISTRLHGLTSQEDSKLNNHSTENLSSHIRRPLLTNMRRSRDVGQGSSSFVMLRPPEIVKREGKFVPVLN